MPQGLKAGFFAVANVRAEALTYHSPRSIRVFQQILRVHWGAFPGFRPPRRTPPGAIFAASLRDGKGRSFTANP